MRKMVCSIALLALLSGCASQASLDGLAAARQDYANALAACTTKNYAPCQTLVAKQDMVWAMQGQVASEEVGKKLAFGLLGVASGASSYPRRYLGHHHHPYRY